MRFPFPPPESNTPGSIITAREEPPAKEQTHEASMAIGAETSPIAVASAEVCGVPSELASKQPEVWSTETLAAEVSPAEVWPVESEPAESPLSPGPPPVPLSRPRVQRKVIAFPRPAPSAPEMLYRLADPVVPEQPRILDVPEELEAFPTTPFLDGLQFGPNAQPIVATHADHVDLPFRAAGITRRLYSALLDGAIVTGAAAVFAAVGHKILPELALTKPVLLAATGLLVLLWAIYQYLLLVYSGATAGMLAAKIRLSTFKGKSPRRRERRQRVMALYFSTASFVMGLLWAFVDVDTLCWHDRISRTYLTDQE